MIKEKRLANGETFISNKIKKFNDKLEVLKELKIQILEEIEDVSLRESTCNKYYMCLHDIESLLSEIRGDNYIYFCNILNLNSLEEQLTHIKNMK